MTAPSVTLKVSWNGDDDFSDADEDISAYVLHARGRRGRETASQLTARSSAGSFEALLWNADGRFSRFKSSSPLFGNLLPGRKVIWESTAPTVAVLWTGFLYDIQPLPGGVPLARLQAVGAFRRLADIENKISAGPLVGAQTGTVVEEILDAADWPAAARAIQTGEIPLGHWYVEDKGAVEALQEVEDAEQGFIYEGLDFDIVFEGRYNRLLNSASSQGTFTDAISGNQYLIDLEQQDPLREVFNRAKATVFPYETGSVAILWTLSDVPFILAPGQSITYIAQVGNGYVNPWTTPVVGTDVLQSGVSDGDIDVVVVKSATRMEITLTNDHASAIATITQVQARGVPVTALDPYQLSAEDATSKAAYGQRSYPFASPWYSNAAYAQAGIDYFLTLKKDPHPMLRLPLASSSDDTLFAHAVERAISERITVVATGPLTELGVNQDFFIEAIEHEYDAERRSLQTSWLLSPAEIAISYWQLDISELGTGTRLAY